jgi:hypothetical protein
MTQTYRLFLLFEGTSFAIAGLIHSGLLGNGRDQPASIAESLIAVVLLIGLMLTWVWPARVRLISLAAQSFALLGTLVGAFTIAIGIGPRSVADIAFHVTILAVLVWGVVSSLNRGRRRDEHGSRHGASSSSA